MPISGIGRVKIDFNGYAAFGSGIAEPNWENIPHKGMPRPSEAEFDSIIERLGESLAEATNDPRKYKELWAEAEKLLKQYVSVVSPDRKALAKDTVEFTNGAYKFFKGKNPDGKMLSLFDFLAEKDAKIKPTSGSQLSVELKSGTAITYIGTLQQPDMLTVKGPGSDQELLGYSSGKWSCQNTPQEQAKQNSFLTRLNNTEKRYRNILSNPAVGKINITA